MKRVVLITGVAGGIGRATARLFCASGWHVVGLARRQVLVQGVDHMVMADVSDENSLSQAFAEVAGNEGRIDTLVNNAAVQVCKPLIETSTGEWDTTMACNVRSVFLAVRNAHPLMRDHAGSVVNVSSVHALATSANIAAYAASKGAIVALTRALAIELASDGIRVNAVLPGAVDTPMLHAGLVRGHLSGGNVEGLMQELGKRTVMGRVGRPEEIAQAILFLGDNERSSFVTGQTLVVDGGATARLSTE